MQAFGSLSHLAISSSGDDLGLLDEALSREGLTRRIEIEVPYLSAGAVITQSDMIAIMARHIGDEFRRARSQG